MKKENIAVLLLTLLMLALCSIAHASEIPQKTVTVFYCVDDTILQAQNNKEDIEKGKLEIEKLIAKSFKKRFNVASVQRISKVNGEYPLTEVASLAGENTALIIELNITGIGSKTVTYSNIFGAEKTGETPCLNMSYEEFMYDSAIHDTLIPVAYAEPEYWAGTMYIGNFSYGSIEVMEKSERTFVKNGVKKVIGTRGEFAPPNKYAEKAKYDDYVAGYYLDEEYLKNKMQ